MSMQFCTLAISTLCPSDTFGGTKIFKWENSISVHPSPSSEIVLPGNPPVRSSEVKSGSGPEVIEAGPGYSRPSDPRTRPTKGPTWKLQNCSRSRRSRWWWARTQVKWGRIIGAMFVYCEETGEGSWSTKKWLHWLFCHGNCWWFERRKRGNHSLLALITIWPYGHCMQTIVVHITGYGFVLKNRRIDDFVDKNWFSLFPTSNDTQLCQDFTKILKVATGSFEFILWVLRIGLLLLQLTIGKNLDR